MWAGGSLHLPFYLRYNRLTMTNLNPIPFDTDWRYFPTEDLDPAYGASQLDESSWGVLPNLADWPRDLVSMGSILHLQKRFDLEPIGDICVRIMLHIESAPANTAVYINGWHAGTLQPATPLVSDITDYVSLEDNLILLNITRKGDLHGVWIQAVPCE